VKSLGLTWLEANSVLSFLPQADKIAKKKISVQANSKLAIRCHPMGNALRGRFKKICMVFMDWACGVLRT
jgi:hypothetical protein